MRKLKRVVIKEELVELTGDFTQALILNQFIYWTERMFDTDKFLVEERNRAVKHDIEMNVDPQNGWIYKTTEDLIEELMLKVSVSTLRRQIKPLIEKGFIYERRNPKYKWDKTLQYRVNLVKVQSELAKLGYALEGYALLPNIIVATEEAIEIEEAVKNEKVEEVKKAVETQKECAFDKMHQDNTKMPLESNTKVSSDTYNAQKDMTKEYRIVELQNSKEYIEILNKKIEDNPNFINYNKSGQDMIIANELRKLGYKISF